MQGTFFENIVQSSVQILKDLEPEEGYYLAFSGGKDSIVAYRLCVLAGVKFDAHYNLTTVDPPELIYFIRKNYPEVIIDKPSYSMWDLIVKNGIPPTSLMRYCCKELKERGGDGRFVVTGIRSQESSRRAKRKQIEFCYRGSGKRYLHVIFNWKESDIWEFIHDEKLEYPCLYDEGQKRVGCIGCPMAGNKQMIRQFERWPKYKNSYLRAFQRAQNRRKETGKNPIGSDYTADAMFNWWIRNEGKDESTEETLFD